MTDHSQDVDMADAGEESESSENSLFNSEPELGPNTFLVDKVLAEKPDPEHGMVYLVKWKGYESKDWSWEPRTNFIDQGMIRKWERERDTKDPSELFDWRAWDRERSLEQEEDEEEEEESGPESTDIDDVDDRARATRFIRTPVRKRRDKTNLKKFVVPDDSDSDRDFTETDDSLSEDEEPDPAAISTNLGSDSSSSSSPSRKDDGPGRRRRLLKKDSKKAAALAKIRSRSPKSASKDSSSKATSTKKKTHKPKRDGQGRPAEDAQRPQEEQKRKKAKDPERSKRNQEKMRERERKRELLRAQEAGKKAQEPPQKRTLPSAIPIVQAPPRKRSVNENADQDQRHYTTAQIMHRAAIKSRREPAPKPEDLILFKPGQKPVSWPAKPAQLSPVERVPAPAVPSPAEPERAAQSAPPKKKISLQQYKAIQDAVQGAGTADAPAPQRMTLSNLPTMRRKSIAPAPTVQTATRPAKKTVGFSLPEPNAQEDEHNQDSLFGDDMLVDSPTSGISPTTTTPKHGNAVRKGAAVEELPIRIHNALQRGPVEVKFNIGLSSEYVGRLRFLDPSPEFRKFWSRLGEDTLRATTPISKIHLPYFVRDFGGPEEWFDIEIGASNENVVRLSQILVLYEAIIFRTEFWQMIVYPSTNTAFNSFFGITQTLTASAKLRGLFFYVGRQKYHMPVDEDISANLPDGCYEHDTGYLMRCYAGVDVGTLIHRLDDPNRKSVVTFLGTHSELCSSSLREMRDAFSCFECEEVPLESLETYRDQKSNHNSAYTVMVHWTMARQLHKIELLQTIRKLYDARFYFWGARPRIFSGEELGINVYTEKVLPFWQKGIVIYFSWTLIFKVPEAVVMIQDFLKNNPKTSKLMVCSDFPRLIEAELVKRKDTDDASGTGSVLAMIYGDSPWNNAIGYEPYHDERYFRIKGLKSTSAMNEKDQEDYQAGYFAKAIASKDIYPKFNRFIFLGTAAHSKRIRDKYPELEMHTPETIASVTRMPVESRSSLLRRIERECEEVQKEEDMRQQRVERGESYFTDQERMEIQREIEEGTERALDQAFGESPEEDYFFDSF